MSALNAGLAADARTDARRARWLAPSLWALSLALIALHYLFLGLSRPAPVPDAIDFEDSWVIVIFALAFSSVGALVASRRPGNSIGWVFSAVGITWAVLVFAPAYAAYVSSAVSLIVRFRRARGEQRQQLKWFAYAAAHTGVAFPTAFALWNVSEDGAGLVMALAITALPIGAGIAILRYRLYDIDLLINRTLVYGVLTAGVVGVYAGTIAFASLAFRERAGVWASVVATA